MGVKVKRQAVVIIHGIGEQRPMSTLKRFVRSLLYKLPRQVPYYSKPDTLSQSFELRRLQVATRPSTDFYEYYWAHLASGTQLTHILDWLRALLIRWPWQTPRHLRPLWGLSVLALLLIVGAVILYATGEWSWQVTLTVSVGIAIAQFFLLQWLGDAARYLSPAPTNIDLRHNVRQKGVSLLRALHRSRRYDRIIVVGHSLGSVIAYDILSRYWIECHQTFASPKRDKQTALKRLQLAAMPGPQPSPAWWHKHQHQAWHELRDQGLPWLVTDFITLGSPLAHAEVLLARDAQDFDERKRSRELPTCPPVLENDKAFSFPLQLKDAKGQPVTLRTPHHAALFCCTRWTNLYFPAYGGLFGDIVGGPIAPLFGSAVWDKPVSIRSKLTRLTIAAHTRYWSMESPSQSREDALPGALETLYQALDLLCLHP